MEVLDQNLRIAINFTALAAADMQALRDQCRVVAADVHLELFKMTTKYDGKMGDGTTSFPSDARVAPLATAPNSPATPEGASGIHYNRVEARWSIPR
jgi:hypothetical protein